MCLLLLAVSCEPFFLSLFPGYLADATAVADLNVFLLGASVEHFDFCVLNNTSVEYAFVLASYYDGKRTLFIFDSDLVFLASITNPGFGARHFVATDGSFVIGNQIIAPYALTTTTIGNTPWPDGQGFVALRANVSIDMLVDGGGGSINVQYYDNAGRLIDVPNGNDPVQISRDAKPTFDLVFCGRVQNVVLNAYSFPNISVLAFRDYSDWPEQGYAVYLLDSSLLSYGDLASSAPLLQPSATNGHLVFPLGGIQSDRNSISVTRDGIVVRGEDKTLRLFGWDGQVQAATRDNGASGKVFFDYSPADYYYVFDPASLKLFKARDWWQTN
jgi:hypothetical protein